MLGSVMLCTYGTVWRVMWGTQRCRMTSLCLLHTCTVVDMHCRPLCADVLVVVVVVVVVVLVMVVVVLLCCFR